MALKETPWFYHPDHTAEALLPEEARHAMSALRLVEGEAVILTDGRGGIARAEVVALKKSEVRVKPGNWVTKTHPVSDKALIIGRLHNAERMEWLIEKCQELGLRKLVLTEMERCGKGSQNLERWQRIAISALKQSHQGWLMEVVHSSSLEEALGLVSGKGVFGYLPEEGAVTSIKAHETAEFAVIGPEADFSEREVKLMMEAGLTPVSLGPTRLRAETASLVAITALLLA